MLAGRPLSWWTDTFDLPLQVSSASSFVPTPRLPRRVQAALSQGRGALRRQGRHPPDDLQAGRRGGRGIDVASPYEMKAALEAGIPGHLLDLNGNAKDDGVIKTAIEHDMLIVIDSIPELERVATLAAAAQKTPRAVLRLSRLRPRRGDGERHLHRGSLDEVRHQHRRDSGAAAAAQGHAGQGARLPHPHRQPDHRPQRLPRRPRQDAGARRAPRGGGP